MREEILDIFFPKRCVICDKVIKPDEKGICYRCTDRAEFVSGEVCFRCGKPLEEKEREYCMDCSQKKVSFRQGRATFIYNQSMSQTMSRFKNGGRVEYGQYLGQWMYRTEGQWLRKIQGDALIPVPIHEARRHIRGYNQAELLALEIGKRTGIPIRNDLIMRNRDTLPQKELSQAERKKNLSGAFSPVSGEGQPLELLFELPKCGILIDDIYTTGSTIEACSNVLKDMGITEIYFLCACIGKGY